jgi:prefoldin alpha subunit
MAGDVENESEKELEELRYMQQIYQNQYAILNNSMTMHVQEMQALSAAQKALENNDLMEGSEALTHTGAGIYMKAKIKDAGHVIVGIGGNYFVEKGIDDAKGYVSKLIEKKTEIINRLTKSRRDLQGAIIDASYKIENSSR